MSVVEPDKAAIEGAGDYLCPRVCGEQEDEQDGMPPSPQMPSSPKRHRSTGRFAVLNAFTDCGMRHTGPTAAQVWFVIFRNVKVHEDTARISVQQIVNCVGRSPRTVMRAVQKLELTGFLEVVRRGRKGRGASVYRVFGTPRRPVVRAAHANAE